MKSLFLSIALFFVVSFSFAQTSTGATITVSNKQVEVFAGSRGGYYYINSSGNKSYLTDAQTAKMGAIAPTVKVSVPTTAQLEVAHKETAKQPTLIDNGATVIFHGVTFQVQTGSRGGRFFEYINSKGNLAKTYLTR